jgi:hypothetical protein
LHFVGQQSRRRLVRLQQQALRLDVQKLERPRRAVFEKARNRHQDHTIQEVSDLGRHGPPKNRCGASPRFYAAYGIVTEHGFDIQPFIKDESLPVMV